MFEGAFCLRRFLSRLFNPLSVSLLLRARLIFAPCLRLPAGIAPNITAGPSDSTVIDGMSVILHCETSGAPRPAITWQKGLSPPPRTPTPRGAVVFWLSR